MIEYHIAPGMEPCEVIAELSEPIAYYEDGMPLDGLLAWAAYILLPSDVREAMGKADHLAWPADIDVPLARWSIEPLADTPPELCRDGRLWGWMASYACAEWLSRGTMHVRKRQPQNEYVTWTDAKACLPGAGKEKACDIPIPSVSAREVRWYCIGHREQIRHLIRLVRALGKKRHLGMGTVLRWTVARSSVSPEEIIARRAIPAEGGMLRAIRAPYWHVSRLVPCRIPDADRVATPYGR